MAVVTARDKNLTARIYIKSDWPKKFTVEIIKHTKLVAIFPRDGYEFALGNNTRRYRDKELIKLVG